MRRAIAVLFAVVVLPFALACGEREQSRIAFHSTRDEGLNVYVMNADGSVTTRLTDSNLGAYPSWSPDGRLIAFVAPDEDPYSSDDRHEDRIVWNIYIMNADGSGVTRLTDNSARDTDPSWSPDGKHVVFASEISGNWHIYVVGVEGTGPIRQTDYTEGDEYVGGSPDGLRGTALTRLTDGPGSNHNPSWSPDGRRVVFVSYRDDESSEVYVMNADGSALTRLTDNSYKDEHPSWSPDGRRIAFNSDRDWELGGLRDERGRIWPETTDR